MTNEYILTIAELGKLRVAETELLASASNELLHKVRTAVRQAQKAGNRVSLRVRYLDLTPDLAEIVDGITAAGAARAAVLLSQAFEITIRCEPDPDAVDPEAQARAVGQLL
jgi:CHAD domain-containing protein